LHIDASGINFCKSLVTNIVKLFKCFCSASATGFQRELPELTPRPFQESGTRKVFFKRYGSHSLSFRQQPQAEPANQAGGC